MLRYLGRYTHRIAISNHRILAFDGERVTFRWRDYAHGNKQREMTLDVVEFLLRFFLHILPKGFVRIWPSDSWLTVFEQSGLLCAVNLDVVPPEPIPFAPSDSAPTRTARVVALC